MIDPKIKSKPTIYAIAGGPAAGKTSYIAKALQAGTLPAAAFIHDCDAVMVSLAGYQQQLDLEDPIRAFNTWELPARQLAEEHLQQQVAAKQDIIYDRTCALPSSFSFLKNLVNNHGYRLIIQVLHVDPEIAYKRALSREAETMRHVPKDIISERFEMVSRLWFDYLSLATEAYLLDNSDLTSTVIAIYKDGNLVIKEPAVYDDFIAIGLEINDRALIADSLEDYT
jgi:predicted ABC-type ATPase